MTKSKRTQPASGLESYGKLITREVEASSRPLAVARDTEVKRLIHNLDHGHKKSCLLKGPSGCGKTAVLHEFFRRIGGRSRSAWQVVETSATKILQGTSYLGEWETRLHRLIEQATAAQRVAIYWQNIHHAAKAGASSASDNNMAATIAPYIEAGQLIVFGECTDDAYARGIEQNPWFEKLFTVFRLPPLADETVREVVWSVTAAKCEDLRRDTGQDVTWTEEAVNAAIQFGGLYFPGMAAPGGALRLVEHFTDEYCGGSSRQAPRRSAVQVNYADLVPALESLTGVPAKMFDDSQPLLARDIRSFFESRIIGQPQAVKVVNDLVMLVKAGLADPSKPLGVLLFCGPTGVGKTEMAKALAEFIFGSRDRLVRLDMSEFKSYDSTVKIIGDPFAGSRTSTSSRGSLLSRIRSQPFAVILLDEIEKAHPHVFDLFLQLFDDGRLSDASGETTSFTQTIVIMTSNLGGSPVEGTTLGFHQEPAATTADNCLDAIEGVFRPELINRIDHIVQFKPLNSEHVRLLARRELGQVLMRHGITRRHLRIDVDPGIIDILVKAGFDPKYGARPLKRAVERLALLPLARELSQSNANNRPALIRLLPAGDSITLKTIHDRQTRKSESLEQGVVINNRAGQKKKVKPREIEEALAGLSQSVLQVKSECRDRDLPALKSSLVARTSAADFWDDPAEAREVMTDVYRIERLLEVVQKLARQVEDLRDRYERARDKKDERRVSAIAQEIVGAMKHVEVVGFSLRCEDRLDRCDAFVSLAAVDEAEQDVVGLLADMYMNWAARKGFSAKMVHEELHTPKKTQQAIILVEGVAIYGLLKNEDGLHQFLRGKTSQRSRRSDYVNVRIWPILDDGVESDRLQIKARRVTGAGLRCKQLKSEVAATDHETGAEVRLRSAMPVAQAQQIAADAVRANRARAKLSAEKPVEMDDAAVLRRYTLGPTQQAKDSRTKISIYNLRELWSGGLDPFLVGSVTGTR